MLKSGPLPLRHRHQRRHRQQYPHSHFCRIPVPLPVGSPSDSSLRFRLRAPQVLDDAVVDAAARICPRLLWPSVHIYEPSPCVARYIPRSDREDLRALRVSESGRSVYGSDG